MRHDPGRRRSGGRAERSVAEPGRAARVSGSLLSFCQLSPLASADPERRSPPGRYCPSRAPTALPPAAARAGCGAPGLAFPAPTARRPCLPGFSSRFAGSHGAKAGRPRALRSHLSPARVPARDRADSQQLARLAARREHCSASERAGDPGADRGRVSGAGVRVPPERLPSASCSSRSVCSHRAGGCLSVCLSVFCLPGARL